MALRAVRSPSMVMGSVFDPVQVVLALRSPAEILKTIIGRIAIKMATLHALSEGLNKCLEYQPVNVQALVRACMLLQ
ncbi:hypothetical protein A5695_10085 [Mycobacterium sp. E1747]|nr:hypothetical protein A5695_10085 [Mycobacterium sp. E1747]